jgi:hypothetical protein
LGGKCEVADYLKELAVENDVTMFLQNIWLEVPGVVVHKAGYINSEHW